MGGSLNIGNNGIRYLPIRVGKSHKTTYNKPTPRIIPIKPINNVHKLSLFNRLLNNVYFPLWCIPTSQNSDTGQNSLHFLKYQFSLLLQGNGIVLVSRAVNNAIDLFLK